MDMVNLNSFLKFGYFLNYTNPRYKVDLSKIDKGGYGEATEDELIDLGIKLWKEAIGKQFDVNEKHVVPLSGGLDSRAILATLLELTEADNIYTYTFGTPGTLDYDIGCAIAKKVGTRHKMFPLMMHEYTMDELINVAKRIDFQTILFLHPPVKEVDDLFGDFNVWSGTIIDVYFGRHTHVKKAGSFEQAVLNSFEENTYVTSTDLSNLSQRELLKYIDYNKGAERFLVLEHIIDLLNRQLKFIAPHVLMRGYNYKLLIADGNLTEFALNIDNKYLENQYLYKKMFLKAFPKMFNYPTKSHYGLPLNANKARILEKGIQNKIKMTINKYIPLFLNPYLNYLDFDRSIREREDLKHIIYENVMDLKQRKIVDWIDIEAIWKRHIDKTADHADALIVLASLEILFKAGKRL